MLSNSGLLQLIEQAPNTWNDLADELRSNTDIQETVKQMEAIAERAARLARYLDTRVGGGCGDQGHAAGNLPDAATAEAIKAKCSIAEGLTILGWPIVINPATPPSLTIALPAAHPLNMSGANEVHMSAAMFSSLALPPKMAIVEQMVRTIKRQILAKGSE